MGSKFDAAAALSQDAHVRGKPKRVDLVLFCASEVRPSNPGSADLDVLVCGFWDDQHLTADEQRTLRGALSAVVDAVVTELEAGKVVLVTCAAGLNRSGLVSGLTLRALGAPGHVAVECVRRARGREALGNRAFEAMVKA